MLCSSEDTIQITNISEALLKEFALKAPSYPMKPEELEARLLLAVEAGYLLLPERISLSIEAIKALKIGQWSQLSALDIASKLEFSPEQFEHFKALVPENARLIRQAILDHEQYLAEKPARQKMIQEEKQKRIAAQLIAAHADR